jgi:hypothetical protein
LCALFRPRRFKLAMAVHGLRDPRFAALGVGNNPNPISDMGSSDIAASETAPPRIHPHLGQVSENFANSPEKQICDVLHDDDFGSNFANEPGIL